MAGWIKDKKDVLTLRSFNNDRYMFENGGHFQGSNDNASRIRLPGDPPKLSPTAGYYSRPTMGADIDSYTNELSEYESDLKQKKLALTAANSELEKLYAELNTAGEKMENLHQYSQGGGIAESLFKKAQQDYLAVLGRYETAASAADEAYNAYTPAYNAYVDGAKRYNDYISEQQGIYNDWKSTVRDYAAIETELKDTNSTLTELKKQKFDLKERYGLLLKGASRSVGVPTAMTNEMGEIREKINEVENQITQVGERKSLLEEELDWSEYFGWEDYRKVEDFDEKSKYVSTRTGEAYLNPLLGNYTDTGFENIYYDYINRNEEAKKVKKLNDIESGLSFMGMDDSQIEEMDDDEIALFNYLYAKDTERGDENHSTAYGYIKYLTSARVNGEDFGLNYRQRKREEEEWMQRAEEDPVGASIFSVLESPLKGLSYLGQFADYISDGKFDQNAGYNRFSYTNSAVRNAVSKKIEESGKWGWVGSFAYQTGMSMGDFLLNTAITGGFAGGGALSEGLSLAIMGTGAAADATIAAKDRGLSDTQAFTLGTIAGAAEILTEKFSIETLLSGKWEENAIKFILKNAFVEGTEEVASDFINLYADILISQDKSEWRQAIDAYMTEGNMSPQDAFIEAVKNQAANIGLDFLGGVLSGGVMAGGTAGIGTARLHTVYEQAGASLRKLGDENMMAIVDAGLATTENSQAHKLALEVQHKMENGTLTDAEIGKLWAKVEEETAKEAEEKAKAAEDSGETRRIVLPAEQNMRDAEDLSESETSEDDEPKLIQARLPTVEDMELKRSADKCGVDQNTYERVRRLRDLLGRNIMFYDSTERAGENGYYDRNTNTIMVNARSRNPVAQIISHELTHTLQGTGAYESLSKHILNRMQNTTGELEARRELKKELYAKKGITLADETAVDQEIVAEFIEQNLLTDEASIRAVVRQNKTVGQRILDWLNNLLSKLGNKGAQEKAFLTRARDIYASALRESGAHDSYGDVAGDDYLTHLREQLENGEITEEEYDRLYDMFDGNAENETLDGEVSFSISNTRNMAWETQVNGYFEGDKTIKRNDSLYLGESSVDGVQNSPLYIPTSVISKAIRPQRGSRSAHELTKTDIMKLKDGINNAPVVIHNPTRNALIYVTGNRDSAGNYIIAVFDINNDLLGENAHKATSIHGRENLTALLTNLGEDATIFVKNENKLNQMLPGAQILKSLALLAKVEPVSDSITDNGTVVKGENDGRQYSISKTTDNKPFVEVEQDILAGVPESEWVSTVKDNLKKKFPNGIMVGNNEIHIDGQSRREMTFSRYMQWLYNNDPQLQADKLRATNNADEILHAATDWVNEGLNHPRKDLIADFARGTVLLRVCGNDYTADVVVGTRRNGSMVMYDVLNLRPTSFTKKRRDAAISTNPSPRAARSTASVSESSVSQNALNYNHAGEDVTQMQHSVTSDEDSGNQYSISETNDGRAVAVIDSDILNHIDTSTWDNAKKEQAKKAAKTALLKFKDGVQVNGITYKVNRTSRREFTRSEETERLARRKPNVFADKMRTADIAGDVITATTSWANDGGLTHERHDNFVDFVHGDVLIEAGINKYKAETVVGITDTGEYVFYDVVDMKPTDFKMKEELSTTAADTNVSSDIQENSSESIVSDNGTVVKRENNNGNQYSISETNDGRAVAVIDSDILNHIDTSTWDNIKKEQAKKAAKTALLKFKDGIQVNGITYKVNKTSRDEFARSNNVERLYRKNKEAYADKMRTADIADDIITATTSWANDGELKHERQDKFVDFIHGDVLIQAGKNKYSAETVVGITDTGEYVFYDVVDMKPIDFNAKEEFSSAAAGTNASSAILENSSGSIVSDNGTVVNSENANNYSGDSSTDGEKQFSLDGRTPEQKREMIANLRRYVNGEMSTREIRSYIDGIDGRAVNLKTHAQTEAERIVDAAHRDNMDVEEYLRYNWELYEQDGVLNEAAREAIELEKRINQRIYSVSDSMTEDAHPEDSEDESDIRSTLPTKARNYLKGAEMALGKNVSSALGVPAGANRAFVEPIIREITAEVLKSGTVRQETVDRLFETAYKNGIVADDEYYRQYKFIKDYLRTQAITISDENKSDIPDYKNFVKSAFGTLRLVNEGGLPVDTAYQELREMATELFPEEITHPADQLKQMFDVAKSIRVAETSIDDYYGEHAKEHKQWAKNDFNDVILNGLSNLREVKRYADDRAQENEQAKPVSEEEVKEAYAQIGAARKASEKAVAKNLLTRSDEMKVGRLLRGEIELEHLDPEKDNVRGITAVYEAKKEYERLAGIIREWNKERQSKLREQADKYLETASDWKDKKAGILYSRETMSRNIRDIVHDKNLAEKIILEYFHPVQMAQAKSTKLKEEMRNRVKALDLSTKVTKRMRENGLVSEAHAVQLLGEATDNIRVLEESRGRMKTRDGKTLAEWRAVVQELWRLNPQLDRAKIENAVGEFRKIYDELFRMMNDTRVRNGYEPVNYRQGYFPHFQPGGGDGIIGLFGRALGIETGVDVLPTSINGMTHMFKPGIQWFGNAQERLGFNTAYDAVEGFDRYIEGVCDVIYQTDNIQKLRALAKQIRYRTGDEGIRKQVDAVYSDTTLSEQDKQNRIDKIYESGRYTLSNFVVELEEYTNLLANKKSRADRNMEQALGRDTYKLIKGLESRVAANMVAINPASWLTNFIPLTQGGAQLNSGELLRGMWQTLRDFKKSDGIVDASVFLTNRRGSDPLVRTWSQKASATLSSPMEYIDQFTAGSLVRARYNQNLKLGLSAEAAMTEADRWTAGVMADRSKGSMPTLFNRMNPLTKLFTQFQLEVNNQLSYLFKDIPRLQKEKGLATLAAALMKFFLGAWLFNEVYEFFIGRRPALDPIGILNDTVGDLTGYELPNLVELGVGAATGDMPSFETEKKSAYDTLTGLGKNVAEELPFVGGLLGGGRLPINSAIPNFDNLLKAATNSEWSTKKRLYTAGKELGKPATYLVLPFGGGQLKKMYEGLRAVDKGGSYTVDADGNDLLQYPVYNDSLLETAANVVGAVTFGKTSLKTGREWVESGFKNFSAKETAAYKAMKDTGVPAKDAHDLISALRGTKKTETPSRSEEQRKILRDSEISGEGKSVVYYGLLASEKERTLMDAMAGKDADMGAVTQVVMDAKDGEGLTGSGASNAKRTALMKGSLTDAEKREMYRYMFGSKQENGTYTSSRDDDITAFESAGLDMDDFLRVQNKYTDINGAFDSAGDKATEFSRWVNGENFTPEQAAVVKDCFAYYSQIPASAARYDNFIDVGLDDDAAYRLTNAIKNLTPQDGRDSVTNEQKWRAVTDSGLSTDDQLTALKAITTESQYRKFTVAYDFGVDPNVYITVREALQKYDADQNGSYNSKEITAAIDSFGKTDGKLVLPGGDGINLTRTQKAVLWQLLTGSTSEKNNPYSTSTGRSVIDAVQKEKEASSGIVLPDGSEYTGGIVLPRA